MKITKRNKPLVILTIFLILFFLGIILSYFLRSQRPNVVLITMDALRPDHLGCYGYPRNTSPNIDKLAREGIIFNNAITQGSHTAPSMASILTSVYPNRNHVFEFGDKMSDTHPTLGYLLKKNGYETAFFSSHVGIATIMGFDNNFNTFYTIWTYKIDKNNKDIKVTEINKRITEWLNANKDKRFFLWVHYLEPHYPMIPPARYKNMFLGDYNINSAIKVPIARNFAFGFGGIPSKLAAANDYKTDLNYYIDIYDATIRYADDCIGDLIDKLKKLKLDKKTIIIFSSDHGESLGEHDQYFTHGFKLYDELIKVPLLVKSCNFASVNKKIDAQVGLIDIMPTVLELTGTKKPLGMEGRSLMPIIKEDSFYQGRYLFSFDSPNRLAVRTSSWKLIYNPEIKQYELYNLKNDPKELNNLVLTEEKQFELLKSELDNYLKQARYDSQQEKRTVLDEESKQKLRSLGYIE